MAGALLNLSQQTMAEGLGFRGFGVWGFRGLGV